MALSFCTFAGFSAIWATLAFHLASPAFGLGTAAAGLFGLWGGGARGVVGPLCWSFS